MHLATLVPFYSLRLLAAIFTLIYKIGKDYKEVKVLSAMVDMALREGDGSLWRVVF
jgi:hypothetical protein